jgi:radical SAM protein with 4Fe4S-binding SPASM domain
VSRGAGSNSLRLLSYYKDFMLRREHPANPPLRLWVDITSRCNLKCTACPQRLLSKDQRRDLDSGLLEQAARDIQGWACQVSLFHRGEALLHPELPWWIKRYKQAGASVRIHTNATLLNLERIAGLLWARPDIVTCSIDSLDPAEYAAARPGADLKRSLAGVELLLIARRELGCANPTINLLSMGAKRPNSGQLGMVNRLKRLGLNRHLHRKPHNWGGTVGLNSFKGKPNTCTFPWYGLTVLSDGRVAPCPQDFFGSMDLGRLGNNSLGDIWQGDQVLALRNAHARHDLRDYPTCQACDRIRRPSIFGVPTEHLRNFMSEVAGK